MTEVDVFSTPMMQQYLELKSQYPDCLIWFRLGDFYEMFLEQAEIGSRILGITLTSRARGKDGRVPMAGIPYHAADSYLSKLINAGYKVAICEQVSQPNGRTLVDRKVVRIVTPGTVLDEKALSNTRNNYVMVIAGDLVQLEVAVADLSTGELRAGSLETHAPLETTLAEVLSYYQPTECLLSPELAHQENVSNLIKRLSSALVSAPEQWSSWAKTKKTPRHSSTAVTVLNKYLEHTQQTVIHHLQNVQPLLPDKYLHLDRSTITNLELFTTLYEDQKYGSLLEILDQTLTSMGGRLLKHWLHKPLYDAIAINQRLDIVEILQAKALRQKLRQELKAIADIERLISRLSVNLGSPRDLVTLAQALRHSQTCIHTLLPHLKPSLKTLVNIGPEIERIARYIETTIDPDPPFDPRSGNVIQAGVNPELDTIRQNMKAAEEVLLNMELAERTRTGITSLKIKYNQVFGFYIEVSKANLHLVPENYQRKQTLVNAERFMTPELKIQEEIVLAAQNQVQDLEVAGFEQAVAEVLKQTSAMQNLAQQIAMVDCVVSLAEVAQLHRYTRPSIKKQGALKLIQSRHPVVEQLLPSGSFVPNDLTLDSRALHVMLLTGPNMAGKSVLMRQVALITLLSHVGSFVPAASAEIPLTDQIFVRSGAADVIAAGLSTFMVEMVETAAILRRATGQSLIIMDEIGRGTSTYDGISIAWAIAEYLAQLPQPSPKTLFATHYHELQTLADHYPSRIANFHLSVSQHRGKPVFLYSLEPGGASHSFGVAVAELAQLPSSVVKRAKQLLSSIETHNQSINVGGATADSNPVASSGVSTEVLQELSQLKIDKLTPLSALHLLAQWQDRLRDD